MPTSPEPEGVAGPPAPAVAAPRQAVGLHGTVAAFDVAQDEWCDYIERLEHYFTANDIREEDKRRAILLNAVGASTYRLIRTLVSPDKVTDVSFEEIVEKAKTHFNPKPSQIVKRYEFNTRRQGSDETISTYVAELRKIAEYCDYGQALNVMLRDRLVCGLQDKNIQRRLLQQSDLTFEKALEVALAADNDAKRLTTTPPDKDLPTQIGKVGDRPPYKPPVNRGVPQQTGGGRANPGKRECTRCGGKHEATNCPYLEYECHKCKKKGHLARRCRQRGRGGHRGTHRVVEESSLESGALEEEYGLFHVSAGTTKPLYATVIVNGQPLSMEVDTGASVSIASQETFESIREGESSLELEAPTVRLKTYTGEPIKVCGTTQVPVVHNGQTVALPLVVTEGSGPTLLGRNWLEALRLDWRTIFRVGNNLTLQQVLGEHKEVFNDELGELRGVAAKIHIDRNARPRFEKSRPVPFAMKKKVEKELERLQTLGIIRPVRFADWAAPIVPVMKSDGGVRICGDYKITVNRASKLEKYPIPRIDELFASLSGGRLFSKLDLSHAYLQVPLDESSQQFVTINTHKGLFTYTRLLFGIASAPSIFQRVMETLLQGIPQVSVYLDDILVTGSTEQEHLANLTQVLQRLQAAGMRLKPQKCAFLLDSVSYLGHVISAEGLHTSKMKVKAIVDAPDQRNLSDPLTSSLPLSPLLLV